MIVPLVGLAAALFVGGCITKYQTSGRDSDTADNTAPPTVTILGPNVGYINTPVTLTAVSTKEEIAYMWQYFNCPNEIPNCMEDQLVEKTVAGAELTDSWSSSGTYQLTLTAEPTGDSPLYYTPQLTILDNTSSGDACYDLPVISLITETPPSTASITQFSDELVYFDILINECGNVLDESAISFSDNLQYYIAQGWVTLVDDSYDPTTGNLQFALQFCAPQEYTLDNQFSITAVGGNGSTERTFSLPAVQTPAITPNWVHAGEATLALTPEPSGQLGISWQACWDYISEADCDSGEKWANLNIGNPLTYNFSAPASGESKALIKANMTDSCKQVLAFTAPITIYPSTE